MKTSDLIGPALDWAVAKCEDFDTRNNYRVWITQEDGQITFDCFADDWEHAYEQARDAYPDDHIAAAEPLETYTPSTDWAQGGPIIEREKICTSTEHGDPWRARLSRAALTFDGRAYSYHHAEGPTPLIAAMRCYVASTLGDEVEIPSELQP